MATKAVTRREAMKCIAAFPLAGLSIACSLDVNKVRYFSTCKYSDGRFGLQALSGNFSLVWEKRLPGRGHAIAVCPRERHVIAVARRPGSYLVTFEKKSGRYSQIHAAENRHFYGHACFSNDSDLLFTTENDYRNGRGVVGVRDVQNGFKQVDEWPAYGVGPHELLLKSDNRTLAVAVGGIQTHPESGRQKLNLPTMQSSLVTIDARSGEFLDRYSLPDANRLLSIRHVAEARDGALCLAMQYQGPRFDHVPLVGFQRGDREIELRYASEKVQPRMRNYCGSVTTDSSGGTVAVSAPRGGIVTFWNAGTGDHVATLELDDCCGVSRTTRPKQFAVSSGMGELLLVSVRPNGGVSVDHRSSFALGWDNHLIMSAS